MTFKPMLAATCEDVEAIKYPVLVSKKLDGIRATVQGGKLLSRTLKPIPNHFVQELFSGLPEGLDGELVVGNPCAEDAYRTTVSLVMSDDKPLDFFGDRRVVYHVFDKNSTAGFEERLNDAHKAVAGRKSVKIVQHVLVKSAELLAELETAWLAEGNEGVMVRSVDGRYKEGRSTLKEGILQKVKRFVDYEGEVIGTFEMEHNGNEATVNALGRTERSSHKENKTGLGVLGGLILKGVGGDYHGVEFRAGTGFDAATRVALWKERNFLLGRIAKVKIFPSGSKDKPRHPVWLGWRSKEDM
jgi:DNA ligase 1